MALSYGGYRNHAPVERRVWLITAVCTDRLLVQEGRGCRPPQSSIKPFDWVQGLPLCSPGMLYACGRQGLLSIRTQASAMLAWLQSSHRSAQEHQGVGTDLRPP
jgi:hypothetical protein